MAWSYVRLWKLLLDRDMKKTELQKAANLSSSALAKMGKKQTITMDALGRICQALDCEVEDVVQYIREDS